MSRLTPNLNNAPFDLFQSSTSIWGAAQVGQMITGADGREFRLAAVGTTTALVSGSLYQGPNIIANHQNLAASTQAIGDNQITVTLGATPAVAQQYSGGYLVINAGTGKGQTLQISSSPAAAGSATLVLTLSDPIVVATLTSDTKCCLIPPVYGPVIAAPTSPLLIPAGLAVYSAPVSASISSYTYAWLLTHGVGAGLADAGIYAVGQPIAASTLTAGAIGSTVSQTTVGAIGLALQTGVSAETRAVYMNL